MLVQTADILPDICPNGLQVLANALAELEGLPTINKIGVVFVSVDPERDSVKQVGEYVRYFHPSFIGVTGDKKQLRALANGLGAQFRINSAPKNYTVSHSMTYSIVGPDGMLQGRIRADNNLSESVWNLLSQLLRMH